MRCASLFSCTIMAFAIACGGSPSQPREYSPIPPDTDEADEDNEAPSSNPPGPAEEDIIFTRRPGFVRVEGKWQRTPTGWLWQSGTFVPEREGYIYVQGHWDKSSAAWKWVEPHWVEGKLGEVWRRGYWEESEGRNTWVPGKWESRRPGYAFVPGRWEQQGDRWVWAHGRWRKNE